MFPRTRTHQTLFAQKGDLAGTRRLDVSVAFTGPPRASAGTPRGCGGRVSPGCQASCGDVVTWSTATALQRAAPPSRSFPVVFQDCLVQPRLPAPQRRWSTPATEPRGWGPCLLPLSAAPHPAAVPSCFGASDGPGGLGALSPRKWPPLHCALPF